MFLSPEPAQIFFFLLEHLSALLVAIFLIAFIIRLHNEEQNDDNQEPKSKKDNNEPTEIPLQSPDDDVSFNFEEPEPDSGLDSNFISKTFKLLGQKFSESKYVFMPVYCFKGLKAEISEELECHFNEINKICMEECKKVGNKFLMIPIYDNIREHYVLFLLDKGKKQYCVLDSLFDKENTETYQNFAEQYCKHIKALLELRGKFKPMNVTLQKQEDGIACGRFVIMYAITLASQENERNMNEDLECLNRINPGMVEKFQKALESLFDAYKEGGNKTPDEKGEALNGVIEAAAQTNPTSESTGQTLI